MCLVLRTYPWHFGVALATVAGKHLRPEPHPLETITDAATGTSTIAWLRSLQDAAWDDAGLASVLMYVLSAKTLDTANLL